MEFERHPEDLIKVAADYNEDAKKAADATIIAAESIKNEGLKPEDGALIVKAMGIIVDRMNPSPNNSAAGVSPEVGKQSMSADDNAKLNNLQNSLDALQKKLDIHNRKIEAKIGSRFCLLIVEMVY
jgi:hypothetical protein